jgi:hypothetical protein
MNRSELDQHLQELFDGRLEGQAFEDLQQELRDDTAARAAYREHLHLQNALEFRTKGVDLLNVVPMDRVVERRQRRTMRTAGLAAAAMLAIGLLVAALVAAREPKPTLTFNTSPGTELNVSHALEGEYAPAGMVLEPGSRLTVIRGTVELEFASGVRGIVRGPADLTLQREDLLELANGTAWFEVPADAVGFKVNTPDLILTDLGTEFGIISERNFLDEVHVFDGKVEVRNRSGLQHKELLQAGQARYAGPAGRWQETPIRRDHFLDELPTQEIEPAVVAVEDFSTTPLAYADDVSDSDLLHGLTPVTTARNTWNNTDPKQLTDGIHGAGTGPGGSALTTVGATAEYHLGTGAKGLGYDITSIQSIADWSHAGCGNQAWTMEVKPVDGDYRILHTVNHQPLSSGGGATKVVLTDKSGVLASGIESIKVTAGHIAGSASNDFKWRELDVFGVPTD